MIVGDSNIILISDYRNNLISYESYQIAVLRHLFLKNRIFRRSVSFLVFFNDFVIYPFTGHLMVLKRSHYFISLYL